MDVYDDIEDLANFYGIDSSTITPEDLDDASFIKNLQDDEVKCLDFKGLSELEALRKKRDLDISYDSTDYRKLEGLANYYISRAERLEGAVKERVLEKAASSWKGAYTLAMTEISEQTPWELIRGQHSARNTANRVALGLANYFGVLGRSAEVKGDLSSAEIYYKEEDLWFRHSQEVIISDIVDLSLFRR